MRLSFSFLLLLLLPARTLLAQQPATPVVKDSSAIADSVVPTDSTGKKKIKEPKPPYVHQLRIGVDVARLAYNFSGEKQWGVGFQGDYLLRNPQLIVSAQAGFGRGKIDNDRLKYQSNGGFVSIGIDKSFLDKISDKDFDIAFVGIHYGVTFGNREEAAYMIQSSFGKEFTGTIPAKSYMAHWGEISAGMRLEIFPHVFAGWNASMRFLINGGVFKEIAPNYVPGYGSGDKPTTVGFNMFVCYGFRWGSNGAATAPPQ